MKELLWDPIRKKRVLRTKEEEVRQQWLFHMIHTLGFPKELLEVEGGIVGTGRRFDILVFYRKMGDLSPLLVLECKAERMEEGLSQVFGYGSCLQIPFMGVLFREGARVFWQGKEGLEKVDFLPSYRELVAQV